ncbi:XTP/dITP diphosphatase [candidate division KSB1 bacterium]|nr:XTP/dITP diphosphatase [candidate division KSB1 bacterium]
MQTLLLATRNPDKIKEIKQVLSHLPLKIISAVDLKNLPEVVEDQPTLKGNAIKKATTLSKSSALLSLADDTGLQVDALDGAPGVYSSRYAGERASYDDNVTKLLKEMQGVAENRRTARFRCVMALADGDKIETVEGVCEGLILKVKRGDKGFGYDPVFYTPVYNKSFAEISLEEKNKISHRGIALDKIRTLLETKFSRGVAQPG